MRRVYKFGLRPPTEGADLVLDQLRAAHNYQNDLIAIERGRRWALRQIDDTPEVRDAVEAVRVATKADRKAAVGALRLARKAARDAAPEELARIAELDASIRKDARAITPCYWGSYLDVEARHQQTRQAPLYGEDVVTPSDPHFRSWHSCDPKARPRLPTTPEGQLGVQLQKGITTAQAYACEDTRVRLRRGGAKDGNLRYGFLSIRVGSEGRDPVWAMWPVKISREIPDSAVWKWVRVSVRHEGRHEHWSCEITVDDPATPSRELDTDLTGTLAVEWEWTPTEDGAMRVARWADDRGGKGEVILPERIVSGIRKPDGIRAVRDKLSNEAREKLQLEIREAKNAPEWLLQEAATMHLWRSPQRLYRLLHRWDREWSKGAPDIRTKVLEWAKRDAHLWDYEAGARGQALRRRRDFYRCLAADWARRYKRVLLSDQDLSREARFGPDSDRRFTASVAKLRQCLRNAFGADWTDAKWRDGASPEDGRAWCERTRDAWTSGGARGDSRFAERKEITTNAWAERKRKSAEKKGQEPAPPPDC